MQSDGDTQTSRTPVRRVLKSVLKHTLRAVLYATAGAAVLGGWFYVALAQRQPDLRPWHTASLEAEYSGPHDKRVTDYASYVALEDALFEELRREVYESGDAATMFRWSRFNQGGPQDPSTSQQAWNRSMEFEVESPVGGVLMLHGATDSPYSMHAVAELLRAEGWHVVIPRYPGHGTAPVGLTTFDWEDLAHVADLAATYLRERIGPDKPLIAVGYSTGAALAAEHALGILEGEDREPIDRIIMLSPALGVTPIAALAKTQVRVAKLLGIPKLAWMSVQPEYDPYRYNSFSVHAGDQVHQLVSAVNQRLGRLADQTGRVAGMPPVLSFMSIVDATVSVRAVVDFHNRLADGEGHELVLFDVDRTQETEEFLSSSDLSILDELPPLEDRPYSLTVIANRDETTDELAAWDEVPAREGAAAIALGVAWPPGVYSLTHVAIPFRTGDANYGLTPGGDSDKPSLGNLQLRGERGLFVISGDDRMRMQSNPFFDYMGERILSAMNASDD
jgi:alpha-beta hydrolase superfamily lysophospholipase